MTSKRLILKHRVVRYITLIFCAPMYMCLIIIYHGLIPELIFDFFYCAFFANLEGTGEKKDLQRIARRRKSQESFSCIWRGKNNSFFKYMIVSKKILYFENIRLWQEIFDLLITSLSLRLQTQTKKECVKCCTFFFNELNVFLKSHFNSYTTIILRDIANSSVKF